MDLSNFDSEFTQEEPVLTPCHSILTHADQEALNVDPAAGKSINALRAFTGKGTMVWGGCTPDPGRLKRWERGFIFPQRIEATLTGRRDGRYGRVSVQVHDM